MTRKDYVLIAAAIRAADDGMCHITIRHLANELAAALAEDNPRFDRERFLIACGVQS